MKKSLLTSVCLSAIIVMLMGCEKELTIEYCIYNYTSSDITVTYTEQLKPSQEDGKNRVYATVDSIAVIRPNGSKSWKYELGKFPSSQKLTEEYNIDGMGITPLWKRIKEIAIGYETLPAEKYNSQEGWAFENDGNSGRYKLFVSY